MPRQRQVQILPNHLATVECLQPERHHPAAKPAHEHAHSFGNADRDQRHRREREAARRHPPGREGRQQDSVSDLAEHDRAHHGHKTEQRTAGKRHGERARFLADTHPKDCQTFADNIR